MVDQSYDALNVNVLNVAKEEYTKSLNSILAPLIYEGIQSIYEDSENIDNDDDVIRNFQTLLKEVPKWNNQIIKDECDRINETCDWMHDLITAVFVTNVKILTSVKIVNKGKQFKLKMPNFETFIHAAYIESARQFFHNPFLLYKYDKITKRNKNKKEAIKCIHNCIDETIRIMLPVQHILQEYMQGSVEDEENIDEAYDMLDRNSIKSASDVMNPDITKHATTDSNKIRGLVNHELENNKNLYEVDQKNKNSFEKPDDLESHAENSIHSYNDETPVPVHKDVEVNGTDTKSKKYIERHNLEKSKNTDAHDNDNHNDNDNDNDSISSGELSDLSD